MKNAEYDLCAAYRIYPGVSKSPVVHRTDKLRLAELGVQSFRRSLGSLRAKVFFILDACPSSYRDMVFRYFSADEAEIVECKGIGNLATFGLQIDLLLKQNFAEVIFFAEDDYVYRPGLMEDAVAMVKRPSIDFVTPYDHVDSYTLPIHTRHSYKILADTQLHWRESASTCLTFLTTKKTLRATESVFRSYCYGNWDSSLWFSLTKFNVFDVPMMVSLARKDRFLLKTIILSWMKGWKQIMFGNRYTLVQPLSSIATHLEETGIAPVVDWRQLITMYESEQVR